MELQVLGPVRVVDGDEELGLGGPRQRRLLAVLVLADGRPVSVDSIVDAVWGDGEAPDGAAKTLQSYVSRLRAIIGERTLRTTPGGYLLSLDHVCVDAREFEASLLAARQAQPLDALETLGMGIARWRGRAFAEFADEGWCRPTASRLEELRLTAEEQRCQALLDLGRHGDATAELERLVAEHPLRDRFRGQLMLALHRSGRQVEALRAFQAYRHYLADEAGLEPTGELVELDQRIAISDPSLHAVATGRAARGYVLMDTLGEGAFGTVYRAVQPSVGREVAVKVVRADLADDPSYVRRFEGEARVVARLEHPHIVPLYDFWREPGGAYLVFRLLKGGSVEDARGQAWPLERVSQLIGEISGALAVAHLAGVVHRDVKPANLLFDEAGHTYLADFGIAVNDLGAEHSHTVRSAGTPLYASPEQIRDGRAGPRSDQYSLAVVAWELLAGRSPFEGSRATDVVRDKLARGVPELGQVRGDLPAAISTVLQRATSIHPEDRYGDMAEFLVAWTEAVHRAPAIRTGDLFAPNDPTAARPNVATVGLNELALANPYKGLRAFDEGDAAHFFGRSRDVDNLATTLAEHRFVAVVGPSGSGKSSLVRAGLIPRLRAAGTLVTTTVPGARPLDELMQSLLRVAIDTAPNLRERLADPTQVPELLEELLPGGELVLVIDQLEELWTQADRAERDEYLATLHAAVTHEGHRVRVVATIRADFYDRPLADRLLGPLIGATVAVTPLDPSGLVEAIAAPGALQGVRAEAALVATLAHEVATEPTSLPLLQYTLTELYERRNGSALTLAAYEQLGGLGGVLQQRAEAVLAELGDSHTHSVRQLFGQLVTPGEAGTDTRRRTRRADVAAVPVEVIEALGAARLLTFDVDPRDREGTVEIAHEALLQHWPRLRSWLDEDRERLRQHRGLSAAAQRWDADGRLDADLLRGQRLTDALSTWPTADPALPVVERAFLGASSDRQRRISRRRTASLVTLGALTLIALVAALVAVSSSRRADRNARDATVNAELARQSAATADERADDAAASEREAISARDEAALRRLAADAVALSPTQRELSLLLAVEAYRREPGVAGESALAAALTAQPGVISSADIGVRGVQSHAAIAARAGVIAVTVDGDGIEPAVVLLDAATLTPTGTVAKGEAAGAVAVRPDGGEIATSGTNGMVRRWNPHTGAQIGGDLPTAPPIVGAWPIAYLPDGSLMVISFGTLSVYAPGADTPERSIALPGIGWDLAVSPSGTSIAVSVVVELRVENQLVVFDTSTWSGEPVLSGSPDVLYNVGFRDDATVLATTLPEAGPARLYDVDLLDATQRSVELPSLPFSMTVLRDGRALVTDLGGHLVVDTELRVGPKSSTTGPFAELEDGRLVAANRGGLVVVDPAERSSVAQVLHVDDHPLQGHVALGSGGSVLLVDTPDGVQRYDASALSPIGAPVRLPLDGVDGKFALSPDGRWIAATGATGTQVFDAASGVARWPTSGPGDFVRPVFSPDGSMLVVAGRQGTIFVLAADDGRELWSTALGAGAVFRTTWSADGRHISLWASAIGRPVLLDAVTGGVERDADIGSAAVVSPDGSQLAVVGSGADLRLVALDGSGTRVLAGGAGLIDAVFSADGRTIIGFGLRGEVRIVDVASGDQLGPALVVADEFTSDVSTTLVGTRLVVGGSERAVVAYELDPDRRAELACAVVGRNLTRAEWDRYLDGLGDDYRATCPEYPAP